MERVVEMAALQITSRVYDFPVKTINYLVFSSKNVKLQHFLMPIIFV